MSISGVFQPCFCFVFVQSGAVKQYFRMLKNRLALSDIILFFNVKTNEVRKIIKKNAGKMEEHDWELNFSSGRQACSQRGKTSKYSVSKPSDVHVCVLCVCVCVDGGCLFKYGGWGGIQASELVFFACMTYTNLYSQIWSIRISTWAEEEEGEEEVTVCWKLNFFLHINNLLESKHCLVHKLLKTFIVFFFFYLTQFVY